MSNQVNHALAISKLSIALHWIVGIGIIALMAVGIYMEENEVYSLYPIHKSVGAIMLVFILWRIIWRIKEGFFVELGEPSALQSMISKLVIWLLLIGTLLFPLSGLAMSAMGGHGVDVFGLQLFPPNPDPANPQKMLPINGDIAGFAHTVHVYTGTAMIFIILLHFLAALKHHFVSKDNTLVRMLGKTR